MAKHVDAAFQRRNSSRPKTPEVLNRLNQHVLGPSAIRFPDRLLLSWQEEIEVLRRAIRLTQDGHYLQDVDIHSVGIDELEPRRCFPPHVLELQALRLQQGVHQIEDIETHALAVQLRKDVAHTIDI